MELLACQDCSKCVDYFFFTNSVTCLPKLRKTFFIDYVCCM